MCGINGVAFPSRGARRVDTKLVEAMRDCLIHRGPDECGLFVGDDGRVCLGHRRLSIVDLASGQQPMANEDGTLTIIFNGEIYNHADFRPGLEARGHTYRSHCDTETIIHLYEEKGARCVEDLRGMFAFAIWDEHKRELFIARDRLGVKPLYYVHTDDGALYFASEIKSLLRVQGVRAEMNYAALPDYLANHAPSGEETLFRGVRRLLPGHTLRWRDGRIEIEKYWDLEFAGRDGAAEHKGKSDADMVAEWHELFRHAVRLRLMADVPLGMFLSGGIDSSAIAATMSGMVDSPIKTFSVAFQEREANELSYARLVAEKFKTEHHETVVAPDDFFRALPSLVWHEDEPLAHPSSVALYFVSKLAREHVTVVLTGEGSDEMMAGYERYYKTILNLQLGKSYHRFTSEGLRRLARLPFENMAGESKLRQRAKRTFIYRTPNIDELYFDNFAVFTHDWQRELLTSETRERITSEGGASSLNPYATMRRYFDVDPSRSLLNRMLYADTKTYLHELLMKQDQMSMAASIESRVPFLDHKLVEYTASLPERMKLRGASGTKHILREAMKGVLPDAILTRSKMGFPVPVGKWFRESYRHIVDEYVLSERTLARNIFDAAAVRRLVARHNAGEKHDERLWALVNFEMWQRRFLDGEAADAEQAVRHEVAAVAS
jgi:asparagine synthase (glutamine-hydrolysing)